MRVTSAPACASSCAAAAASRALNEPCGSIRGSRGFSARTYWKSRSGQSPRARRGDGISPCDTPRRGPAENSSRCARRLLWKRRQRFRDRRRHRIGELHERRARRQAVKASRISRRRVRIGLVTSGRPETTADAGAFRTSQSESRRRRRRPAPRSPADSGRAAARRRRDCIRPARDASDRRRARSARR